ncbi:MAG: 3,4-dehydroadipyl-CoA semialdehyde dehydrogenase [Planctomycetes bacterium]|jgi:oxepin-CoA hydrolase/3-oxo-5,6-dehydrosuberyl-CoA semialdehyde dehydrogenase|nr:3,4-dehydroadipyl-CoA semialdehyde dehydrogenase [Planctomycetota bacterium]
MISLQSYVRGRWVAGSGDTKTLHDPATEAVLGDVRQGGVDFAEVLAHATTTGGPALRAMTFPQRAEALKALSAKLHEHRDELLDIATQNGGNTRGDGKFDLDGCTGTLAYYAQLGSQLPAAAHLVDGDGLQLTRSPRFFGQHVLVPRPGAAVHINAFNFPAWGMGEKMACALLAGVPVIEKAGTPSALLAYRIAQLVVDSKLLPEGAFQFLAGSVSGLLDLLGPMDTVAFTGSSATGALIRGNKHLVTRSVRVNIEADSINPAVLGPDADGDTFEQFVANIATDMTQKAGQKCTAVRRILVPADRIAEVEEALVERLRAIKVGNPANGDVRMGPVASSEALATVRAGMQRLQAVSDTVLGGPQAIADRGYFVAPTLLRAKDPNAAVLHELEVFGPCATMVAYDGTAASAAALCNRGGGGLVASAYSDDRAFVEALVLGIAPWHGRVWLGSEKTMSQATPPGAVLPATIHGGPGRAGGGEELGGLRGLHPYLQRTAIQGDRAVVGRAFGRDGA